MGMFNSIIADVVCPVTGKLSPGTLIQMKWQAEERRWLTLYRIGDVLEMLRKQYDNTWIRTDFICDLCSKKTPSKLLGKDMTFIRTEDQIRHLIFVRMEKSKILEIVNEPEFAKKEIQGFVDYL